MRAERTGDSWGLGLDLPACHESVVTARHVIGRFAELEGLAERERDTLMLVASELLGNAVDHGGGERAMGAQDARKDVRMRVSFEVTRDGWTVRVSDQGGGDPDEVEALIHPDGLPDLEDERGRGFFLLAQMVDRLEVARSEDGRGLTFTAVRDHGGG